MASPLLGLTIEFNRTNYTVHEGGVAMLRIVKIGEADYPMSVNLSTVDGSAVGEFIDIIGGEGKLISLGGTVMPETYVTVHQPDFTRGCLITCNTMPTYCT